MARGTSAETRARIGTAAASLSARGYARTSVRDIASSAGADPVLVIRRFGSKELLFLEVMHPALEDDPLIVVPIEQLGRRFIEFMIEDSHGSRDVYLALVRGSSEPSINDRLRGVHERTFAKPLLSRLSGEDAEPRARLAASLAGGRCIGCGPGEFPFDL